MQQCISLIRKISCLTLLFLPTTGYSSMYINAGKVTNKGIELSLGYKQN